MMAHYLESFGCQVLTAASGEEGITVAQAQRPDLITLDLVMPGMTGWEALRALKDDDELRGIPVVIVSAFAATTPRGGLLGAVDMLSKPVDRDDLLRVVWKNVSRRGQRGRILLVEDDEDTRVMITEYLEEYGLEVLTASDGIEALRLVKQESPDAVVLDLVMPVMDGRGFLDELRTTPYQSGLPVIVLTGKDLQSAEHEDLMELASGVVPKGDRVEKRLAEVLRPIFSELDDIPVSERT
jgi:CheY-like chemotaxis protein